MQKTCKAFQLLPRERDHVHPQQPLSSMFKSQNSTSIPEMLQLQPEIPDGTKHICTHEHTHADTHTPCCCEVQLLLYVLSNKRAPFQSTENHDIAHSSHDLQNPASQAGFKCEPRAGIKGVAHLESGHLL